MNYCISSDNHKGIIAEKELTFSAVFLVIVAPFVFLIEIIDKQIDQLTSIR